MHQDRTNMETQDRSFKATGRKTEYRSKEAVVGEELYSKEFGELLLRLLQLSP